MEREDKRVNGVTKREIKISKRTNEEGGKENNGKLKERQDTLDVGE